MYKNDWTQKLILLGESLRFTCHHVLFRPGVEQLHVVFRLCNERKCLGPSQDCIKGRFWTEVRVPSCMTTIVGDQQVVWSRYWELFFWLTDQLIHKVVHWGLFLSSLARCILTEKTKNQNRMKKLFQNNVHYVDWNPQSPIFRPVDLRFPSKEPSIHLWIHGDVYSL